MNNNDEYGIGYEPFKLDPERREWLKVHGTVEDGEITVGGDGFDVDSIDDGGVICYYGMEEAVRREKGMEAIEATPTWILKCIENHARGNYQQRDGRVWPDTKWDVQIGIKHVFSSNYVTDDDMPLRDRKKLVNFGAPLISRFLIRENPEYGETHFIGIRRRQKRYEEMAGSHKSTGEELDDTEQKQQAIYTLDDYLFPELRDMTPDTITAPYEMASSPDEQYDDYE